MAESFTDQDGKPRYGVRLSDIPEDERPDMSVFAAEQAKQRAKEEQAAAERSGGRFRPTKPSLPSRSPHGDRSSSSRPGVNEGYSWRDDDGRVDPYAPRHNHHARSASDRSDSERQGQGGCGAQGLSQPPLPPGRRQSSPASARLLLWGLVTMFLLPVLIFFAAASYMMGGLNSFTSSSVVEANGDVYLAANTDYMVYSSGFGVSTGDCTVKDPHGSAVSVEPQTSLAMASFHTGDEGLYSVTCPNQENTQHIVGPVFDESRVFIGVIGVIASTIMGLLGLGMIIVYFARRKRR
ncbi:hypothetical protein [Actinomyces vulturis]|uniref:hypothetical protein n=1 Tax=Actinomyces vulturis TaxID=1857645 RepID=UPI000834BB93|nr:hypothetical protein [Actinomyces vulturis]